MHYIIGLIAGLVIGIGVSYQPACLVPSCYPTSGQKAIIDWRGGGDEPFCIITEPARKKTASEWKLILKSEV